MIPHPPAPRPILPAADGMLRAALAGWDPVAVRFRKGAAVAEGLGYSLRRDGAVWSMEETRMALVLYLTLEKKDLADSSPQVRELARALGRKPGSVAKKIGNIQAHDRYSDTKGLSHGGRRDKEVWDLYEAGGHAFLEESMALLSGALAGAGLGRIVAPGAGHVDVTEARVWTKQRVSQQRFRSRLVENYGGRCCLTGMTAAEVLVASHIKTWADADDAERLSPANGLLLNAYHDRAFDRGLITIDPSLRVVVSEKVKRRYRRSEPDLRWLLEFEGAKIAAPSAFPPDPAFVAWHNERVFVDSRAS